MGGGVEAGVGSPASVDSAAAPREESSREQQQAAMPCSTGQCSEALLPARGGCKYEEGMGPQGSVDVDAAVSTEETDRHCSREQQQAMMCCGTWPAFRHCCQKVPLAVHTAAGCSALGGGGCPSHQHAWSKVTDQNI